MNWNEILKTTPRDFHEQEKDELCKNIIRLNDIDDINLNKLKKLFRLSQDILKFKDEQVELLMKEFDEIARKQGIEDAKIIHSLENEIKSLRSSSESRLHTPEMDLVKENDYLKVKIKTLKSALKSQTQEIEQLKRDLLNIQEEKNMLQSELINSTNRDSDSQSDVSEVSEKYKHLTGNLKQKNTQISQILSDVEFVEKENISIKEKTISLKNELHEATEHITNMTVEISSHKNNLIEMNEKINTLSKENTALRNQIEELIQQKQDHENELDNFTSTLDNKIDELKKLLDEKQSEIKELKHENVTLERKVIEISNINKLPTKILEEKDEQIEELESKLIEATQEIEKNTTLLNNIAISRKQHVTDIEHDSITDDLKAQLLAAHERCQELQTLLQSTEKDAQERGQQLTELLNQLRKYEEGQYGLSDALREMQELRVQINIRDKQISDLIQTCNKYQTTCDEVEYENLALREKCGLPLDHQISKNGVITKHRKQKKLINNLQNQIEVLEDEKLQLKVDLQNFKRIASNVSKTNGELNKMTDEIDSAFDYKKKYADVSEENEALRKGLHEILDSVRTKKDTSDKEIKSETLENLLHILDARHVTGWYHPAMKLQTEVNILQGTNEELRNQLKLAKSEMNQLNEQLQQNELKLHDLQIKIQENNTEETASPSLFLTVPPNISSTSSDIISKLNSHLLVVLNEYNMELENSESLKETLEKYKQEMNIIKQQINLLYQQFSSEKNDLKIKYEEILSEKENLTATLESLQSKFEEYLNKSSATQTNTESKTIYQKLSNDFIIMNRKCLFLEENEKKIISENNKLKQDMCQAQIAYNKHITDFNIERNNLQHKLNILENTLRESVPKSKLDTANKTIYDLTVKQHELLENTNCFKDTDNIALYKKQIDLLNSEKDHLFSQIIQLKAKKLCADHANDSVSDLTKKLATCELNCYSERQRADHVNSLYELIKEQLKKSEERCVEYENQNKILINNNLKIQLNQQEFQDKLIKSVSQEDHQIILNKLQTTQDELNNTRNKYIKLQTRYKLIENEMKTHEMFKTTQNLELMNLKHLLLDLQSTNDEKALIARLSTEVVLARICESDSKNQVDILTNELKEVNDQLQQKEIVLTESNEKLSNIQNQYHTKMMLMEQILFTLRSQYLGHNPLYSQERIIDIFHQIYNDKQIAFNELQAIQKQKNDIILLQEQLNLELSNAKELKALFLKENTSKNEKLLEWYKDKHILKINELKYRRSLEIKEQELNLALKRIKYQDNELLHLDEELVNTSANILNNLFITNNAQLNDDINNREANVVAKKQLIDIGLDPLTLKIINQNSIETQTIPDEEHKILVERIICFENEIQQMKQLIALKDTNLQQQECIIADYEKNIETLNVKIREKETQIKTTENISRESRNQVNVIDEVDMKEHNALKQMVTKLQVMIAQKEELISKYEALLKEGKDAHSLAAIRFQDEIKQLQNQLQIQQIAYQELKDSIPKIKQEVLPNRSAIEQYVSQVHVLEGHMAELETTVSSLNSQLHASRQECVRWRTLANDRLNSIETLRKELEEQQQDEITTYKNEYEKYKEENITIKHELSKLRVELNQIGLKNGQEIQARDTKIHEVTMELTQLKNELKMHKEGEKLETDIELTDLQLAKQVLETEHSGLKKRYNNLLDREKSARDEIMNLRKQLMHRPSHAVRNVRSDKSVKEQLQKKIAVLEQELNEANEKLEKDAMMNTARRAKIAEDFTYWEKYKRLQQIADKTKEKLALKVEELEKMQHSYTSAKTIINRLEREKHVLEGKLKYAKSLPGTLSLNRVEATEQENKILKTEIEMLNKKLEMQQHHSGGLGAAMLQEKLEAQERKIAVLELSKKGSAEITAELERLNNAIASYQKINLRLEAENLDLSVNLKKTASNVPFLREQIQHLERYISVLKSEQAENHVVTSSGDQFQHGNKIAQLEKTVVSLKSLVEKLQAENKRLQEKSNALNANGDKKPVKGALEKCQLELKRVREQYSHSIQKINQLENELSNSQKRIRSLEQACEASKAECDSSLSSELNNIKEQLARKSELLDKVKILLQKAALKEKFLQDQIEQLKAKNSINSAQDQHNTAANTVTSSETEAGENDDRE